jgi:hypothetical protein
MEGYDTDLSSPSSSPSRVSTAESDPAAIEDGPTYDSDSLSRLSSRSPSPEPLVSYWWALAVTPARERLLMDSGLHSLLLMHSELQTALQRQPELLRLVYSYVPAV